MIQKCLLTSLTQYIVYLFNTVWINKDVRMVQVVSTAMQDNRSFVNVETMIRHNESTAVIKTTTTALKSVLSTKNIRIDSAVRGKLYFYVLWNNMCMVLIWSKTINISCMYKKYLTIMENESQND